MLFAFSRLSGISLGDFCLKMWLHFPISARLLVVSAPGLCSVTVHCCLDWICGLSNHQQLNMFADATILVVVTPHQFIGKQLPLLKSVIAPSCHAISLIKVCRCVRFPAHIQLCSCISGY
jgi:hypothetical protein